MTGSTLPITALAPLAAMATCAAFTDLKSRRIPNWLSGAGLVVAFSVHITAGGLHGLWFAAQGMAVAFGIYFFLYLLRALGAGDVKLMAAVGAFAGLSFWLEIFVATAIIGAVAALFQAAMKKRISSTVWNTGFIAFELLHFRAPYLANASLDVKSPKSITLPHGVAIALGVLLVILFR